MEQTVFIGGPIQYAIDGGEFHCDLHVLLESVLNSTESAGYRVLSAHRFEKFGEVNVDGQHFQVARRDFAWMQSCDVFMAILPNEAPGVPMRTDGTCVELGWASSLGRPVVIVRDLEAEHSHLVKGLGAIARVEEVALSAVLQDPKVAVSAITRLVRATEEPLRVPAQ